MKVLCYVRADATVAIGSVDPILLQAMQGRGYGWSEEKLAYELGKYIRGGYVTWQVLPFLRGLAIGGMTETEALNAIGLKDKPVDCLTHHIMDSDGLPRTRTHRDTWRHERGQIREF